MKTVKEVSKLTGVSVRTLHYYDSVGLLKPAKLTESGYRLYNDHSLEQLSLILIYRELGFSIKETQEIISAPDAERNKALERKILLLEEKRQQIQNRIYLARGIKMTGVKHMNFKGFERDKIDEYSSQAKALWGKTEAYKEYEEKSRNRNAEENNALGDEMMELFRTLGSMRNCSPESCEVQEWVKTLQSFITENFYTCTPQILSSLGVFYAGGGSMTENIDAVGGSGTGEFAYEAIKIYCADK